VERFPDHVCDAIKSALRTTSSAWGNVAKGIAIAMEYGRKNGCIPLSHFSAKKMQDWDEAAIDELLLWMADNTAFTLHDLVEGLRRHGNRDQDVHARRLADQLAVPVAEIRAPAAAPVPLKARAETNAVEDDDNDCIICRDQERTFVIVPCGHFQFCDTCANTVKNGGFCPTCRGEIKAVMKVHT